jgi:hypothetical protein
MENHPQSVPNIRDQAYELAYSLASEQLGSLDLETQCIRSGAKCIDSTKAIIHYLNRPYVISIPDVQISLEDGEEEVPLKDKILILHYLTSAKGTPATGRLITFKQLPGCASYFPVFEQLAVRPLLKHFGKEPALLIRAAAKLGGYEAKLGDVGVTINAFRRVPISIAMWRGDEEFAPSANIMFDSNISDYLPTEDIRDICAIIARRLIGLDKRQQ